jgi:hypothetical protein
VSILFHAKARSIPVAKIDLVRKYGEMAQMFIGPMRVVLASSPQAVEKLFRERPNNFKRSFNIEKQFQDSGVPGLFSMEGECTLRYDDYSNYVIC